MFGLFQRKFRFFPTFYWQDLLVLIGGVGVYVALASSTVTKFSIWFDEAFGSYLVRFDFISIARYTASDVHPPVYYWFLKLWTMTLGNTELAIRSMSIFFGAVTIIFAFLLVLRLFGRRTAYLTIVFLVLSPMFIRYSQEARMYTLLTAEIVAATYLLVYALHTKKQWPWVAYGSVVALGMLTQYFTAFAWAAHWVWRYVTVRTTGESFKQTLRKIVTRNWKLAYMVAFGLFVPWLPFLIHQYVLVQGHGFWIPPVTPATLIDFITNVLIFGPSTSAPSWIAAGVILVVLFFGYTTFRLMKTFRGDEKSNYALIVCLVAIPPLLLFLISMPPLRPAFVDRYLMGVVVFIAVLMAINLTQAKFVSLKLRTVVVAVLVVMMGLGIYNQATIGNYNRSSKQSNNVRQLLEQVRAKAETGTPIVGSSPWIFYEAVAYESPQSPVYFVNETTQYKYGSLTMLAENDTHKIRDLDAFSKKHNHIWLISNLRENEPKPLRSTWHPDQSITINDDLTGKPLFNATRFTVE